MMRCPNCTQAIPDQASFCRYCGSAITKASRSSPWFAFFGAVPGLVMVAILGLIAFREWSMPRGQVTELLPTATGVPVEIASPTAEAPTETLSFTSTPVPASATSAPPETPTPPTPTETPQDTATPSPSATPTSIVTQTPTPIVWTREQIEAAVRDAVERFQRAKEYSQKTGDTSRLSDDLAGQALDRQIQLVNETKAANCSWEISLDSPMTYQFIEIRGDDYVMVKVNKTETTRKYCDGKFVAASSQESDNYNTSYIVQRFDSRWYVTGRE